MPFGTAARRRLVARTALFAAFLTGLALGVAPTAHATSEIAQKRAEAHQVAAQVQELDMRLESAIQAYDGARVQLAGVRRKIAANTLRLRIARANLHAAQQDLARLLVSAYKGGGPDVTAYVLSSHSFSELVDRVDLVDRMSRSEGDLLDRIARTRREIARRQAELKRQEAQARRLVAERARRRREIEAGLAQRRELLASIQSDIKRLIREAELRRERLAREAAARAAREEAAREAAAARQAAAQRAAQEAAQAAQEQQDSSSGSSGSSGSSPPPQPPPPPAGSVGQQAAQIAQRYLGVPYVWGGASPSGFDCSGLVMYVYAQLGISLPHYTVSQYNSGPHVSRGALAPGDLVFFDGLGHVGIYLGGGSFIHAPHTGDVVKISSLYDGWYSSSYAGATRVAG
jgi:peptidoglycan DL-endopeptidase CwlO